MPSPPSASRNQEDQQGTFPVWPESPYRTKASQVLELRPPERTQILHSGWSLAGRTHPLTQKVAEPA